MVSQHGGGKEGQVSYDLMSDLPLPKKTINILILYRTLCK